LHREKLDKLENNAPFAFGPTALQQSWQAGLIESVYKNKWNPDQQQDLKSFSTRLSQLSTEQRAGVLADRILDTIYFAELQDRYEAIPEAYRKTFEWVFQEPGSNSANTHATPQLQEKDSFVRWLRSPEPLYWITGKPGSGKSTLMKYLYRHPALSCNLQQWHQEHRLVTAGFFFWNSGTHVQMSQVGLLRSLLYQVLAHNRELLPLAFPKRWEAFELNGGDPNNLSWTELTTGLKAIIGDKTRYYCFFVDGLDEFDGDPAGLVQLVAEISCNTNVKVCASSRPWLVFEEAFSSRPWLRVESLTYNDISFFVKDKMEQSRMFATIQSVMPETAISLIHEITERASGVFLWVHIVVKSLLEGLRDGDTIEELHERLRALPSDLEELFRKILHRLNPFNFKQSCEVFLLHKAAGLPITLLDLVLAKDGCDKALRAPFRPFTEQELEYYSENMRRFLNSRCKGLLEAPDVLVKKHEAKVQYLHRTVRDFFQQASILKYIKSGTLDSFDPVLQLSAAYLARVKSIQLRPKLSMVDEFWCAFYKAMHNAKQIESSRTLVMFLDKLEEISTQFWAQKMQTRSGEMSCLQVLLRQTGPERELFNASLSPRAFGEAESTFWGNTQSYISDDIHDLTGSTERSKWYPQPLTSFFDLTVQLNVHRYVISRLENDIPITYMINGETLFKICNTLQYSELEEYLVSRKSPGSKVKKHGSNELKQAERPKPGTPHKSWFKRLSRGKSSSNNEPSWLTK
jgi:hypothetical protein